MVPLPSDGWARMQWNSHTCEDMVEIREAGEGDDAQIAALWTEAYCGPAPGQRGRPYELSDVESACRQGRIFVAGGKKISGVVVLYAADSPGRETPRPKEAELSRLAVSESTRRRGIGRALTRRCLQTAEEEGAEAVVLWSSGLTK